MKRQQALGAYRATLVNLVVFLIRHPLAVFGFAILLALLSAGYVARHFQIDTNTSALLSRDLGFQRDQRDLNQAFPQLRNTIVVVIKGATPGRAEQAAARLAHWAAGRPQDFQSVYQPGGGPFFARNGLLYLSPDQLDSLGNRLARAQPLIASLANDPSLSGLFHLLNQALTERKQNRPPADLATLVSGIASTVRADDENRPGMLDWQQIMSAANSGPLSRKRRFLIIKPCFDYARLQPAAAPIAHLRAAIRQIHLARSNTSVRLTGPAVLDNDQLGAVSQGAGWATGLALALIVLLLIIALRSVTRVLATLITLMFGLVWSTALGLFIVGQFNILSIAFAVLFIGLGVDFGIQFCMRSREVAARGIGGHRILPETVRGIAGPLTLAGLASAASFFSVVPTHYAGLADLGAIAGVSMLVAVASNLLLLPALLRLFGSDQPSRIENRPHAARWSYTPLVRWNRAIVGIATLAGIAAIPVALGLQFDFNPLSLENPDSEAMRTLNTLLHSNGFSPYRINILEPNLTAAKALAAGLEQRPTVDHALTLADYVPDQQTQKLSIIGNLALTLAPGSLQISQLDAPRPRRAEPAIQALEKTLSGPPRTRPRRKLAAALKQFRREHDGNQAALAALQQRLLGTLPHQLAMLKTSLNAQRISLSDLPGDLKRRYLAPDGRARVEVFSSLDLSSNANLARFVHDVRQVAPHAVGTPVLLVEGGRAVTRAFTQASITAFIAIALLLWLVLRRWRDVALALSPLPLAGLLTGATMVLLDISFDLANIIVLPLLIGLGVAYGIYFVTRWRDGQSPSSLLESSTPSAVLFSALTTLSSFGSLALADSRGMAILGQTLCIALAYVLITTLLVLPALLSLFGPSGHRR